MTTDHTANPWLTLSSETYHEDEYLRLDVDQVQHQSGVEHPYTAVRFKVFGLTVLPIDDAGRTFLVGQYRYLLDRYLWELPRGGGAVDVPPIETAKRELAEETGHSAAHWFELPKLTASPGITSEWAPCYIAWGLCPISAETDPQESLSIRRLPFGEAVNAVLAGEVVDAASVALLLGTAERARRGQLPQDLAALLGTGGL
ncbi:NUDIX domain-containing protein [Methylobacterium fujisawaense]